MHEFFTTREDGDATVVEFQTESLMNSHDLERIGQALNRLIDEQHRSRLVLDFSKVRYLSSQAIGILIALNKKLSQLPRRGELTLTGVGPQLLDLLRLTRLDKLFKVK